MSDPWVNALHAESVTVTPVGAIAATDVQAALAEIAGEFAQGVAAGYRIARGQAALDGSNPTVVASGLTTIIAAVATLKGTAAPGTSTSVLTVNINTTNIDVYAWKPSATADTALVASTGTESFYWIAVGT